MAKKFVGSFGSDIGGAGLWNPGPSCLNWRWKSAFPNYHGNRLEFSNFFSVKTFLDLVGVFLPNFVPIRWEPATELINTVTNEWLISNRIWSMVRHARGVLGWSAKITKKKIVNSGEERLQLAPKFCSHRTPYSSITIEDKLSDSLVYCRQYTLIGTSTCQYESLFMTLFGYYSNIQMPVYTPLHTWCR